MSRALDTTAYLSAGLSLAALFALCVAGIAKLARGKFWKWSNRRRCAESMARWKGVNDAAR